MSIIDNNKSYTNKDFQSIYDELLDLIPTLTNKWNPTNEADPGIVLTKLMAVLGDKLNYNIDKQVLECFPASVTQRKNARQIYNLIGYRMNWYKSAIVDVNFKLTSILKHDVTVPKFTQITDANNTISFITLSDVILDYNDIHTIHSVPAIQGYFNILTVDGSSNIRIVNLDENFRIYFSDINIAENGLFISDSNSNVYDWEQVNNVSSYPLGSKVFEFGISDDETSCYIQFPSDINELLSNTDAVNIKYITSLGSSGNILSYVLDSFSNSIIDTNGIAVEDNIAISQPVATINGSDPETIEEAYRNAKKVVNTFETLITRLDYENYIKTLESNNKKLVSNAVVCDRTNDLNETTEVLSLNNGEEILKKDFGNLTPYDIVLYLLDSSNEYKGNFLPVRDESKVLEIEGLIEDIKAINLNYLLPQSSLDNTIKYLYRGVYTLKGQIVSSEKLTSAEAAQLEETINSALQTIYSAKNVNFGEGIDYNELLENVQGIDSRIKAVILDPPTYSIEKITYESDLSVAAMSQEDYQEMVAKMVARGNIQFYLFDKSFDKEFGQENAKLVKNITNITTDATIALSTTGEYILKANEIIDLYTPNYYAPKEYTVGCRVLLLNVSSIPKETYYTLTGDEQIKVSYADTSGTVVNEIIKDTIVYCSSDLTSDKSVLLTSSGYLKIYERNDSFISKGTPIIFVLDSESLTIPANRSYVLGADEYILYTNKATTEIIKLGSGVLIENNSDTDLVINNPVSSTISSADILNTIAFQPLQVNITAVEQEILSLNEGCIIKLEKDSGEDNITLSYNAQPIPTDCYVTIVDSSGTYTKSTNAEGNYYNIRSRLVLNYTTNPITLLENQSISFLATENETIEGTATGKMMQFSAPLFHTGGSKDISEDNNLNCYIYTQGVTPSKEGNNIIINTIGNTTLSFNFGIDTTLLKYLIPITVTGQVTVKEGSTQIYDMSTFTSSARTNVYSSGDYILEIPASGTSLTFTLAAKANEGDPDPSVIIGKIYAVRGINTSDLSGDNFIVTDSETSTDIAYKIINKINNLITDIKFNYLHEVNNLDKCVNPSNADTFFNLNHIYNRFSIPMLDIENSYIKVNQFSIK